MYVCDECDVYIYVCVVMYVCKYVSYVCMLCCVCMVSYVCMYVMCVCKLPIVWCVRMNVMYVCLKCVHVK